MRTVSVSWDKEGGRFTALGSHAGHPITINAPRDESETACSTVFPPTELLLAGAGACSAWDVVEILRKRRASVALARRQRRGHAADDPPWAYRESRSITGSCATA